MTSARTLAARVAPLALHAALMMSALVARPASALSPETERAIALGREANEHYEANDYAGALERFEVADRMAHSVVFVLYMARCERNLGHLVAARALFERVASEALPDDATEPMHRATRDAKSELAALAPRIPAIVVRVRGTSERVDVRLDGRSIEAGVRVDVDPGEHAIEARDAAGATATKKVTVAESSGATDVALDLATGGDDAAPHRGSLVPGAILLGVAGAGVVVGAVTGGLALSGASTIQAGCVEGHCLTTDAEAGREVDALATASTVSFVAASVSAAVGVVLLVVRPGGSRAPAAAVRVGPRGVWITGAF